MAQLKLKEIMLLLFYLIIIPQDNSSFNWQNTSFVGAQRLRLNYDDDNTSLGDIMTILPDGKVGIGIAAPTTALHVVGDGSIKIEGDHASVVLFDNNSTDNSSFNWQNTSFVGAQRLRLNYDDDNTSLGDIMTILPDGKVGIGIAAPTTALHVVGDGSIKIEGDHASVVLFDNNSTDNSSFNWQNTSFSRSTKIKIKL